MHLIVAGHRHRLPAVIRKLVHKAVDAILLVAVDTAQRRRAAVKGPLQLARVPRGALLNGQDLRLIDLAVAHLQDLSGIEIRDRMPQRAKGHGGRIDIAERAYAGGGVTHPYSQPVQAVLAVLDRLNGDLPGLPGVFHRQVDLAVRALVDELGQMLGILHSLPIQRGNDLAWLKAGFLRRVMRLALLVDNFAASDNQRAPGMHRHPNGLAAGDQHPVLLYGNAHAPQRNQAEKRELQLGPALLVAGQHHLAAGKKAPSRRNALALLRVYYLFVEHLDLKGEAQRKGTRFAFG